MKQKNGQVVAFERNISGNSLTLSSDVILAEIETDVTIEALVGPACDISVVVEGVKGSALLDSGSQVSVISESFYRKNLSHVPLQKLQEKLEVTGAGGHDIPYLGVIQVSCSMPEAVTGSAQVVQLAALVCKDTKFSQRVPLIIGTNAFRSLN